MENSNEKRFGLKFSKIASLLLLFFNAFISFAQGCPEVPISILDGANGFVTEGINQQNKFGNSVKNAGDINGDGISDVIIGSPYSDSGINEGNAYVIFGGSGVTLSPFDISILNGSNGFVITGTGVDNELGFSVSTAGDFNDDGIDDIIIGAPDLTNGGKTIILFGTNTGFSPSYTPSDINGINGIILEDTAQANFGYSVNYAGDVNTDGIADIIISSPTYDTSGFRNNGRTYVVFGNSSVSNMNVSSLDGSNGFIINGFLQDNAGLQGSISNVGDVNNDTFDDIIMGFPSYEVGGSDVGRVCIIYGKNNLSSFPAVIDLEGLSVSDGFSIIGEGTGGALGFSVGSAGDFNNDGIDDLVIGDPEKDVDEATNIGEAYLIHGRSSFPSSFIISDFFRT